MEYKVWVWVWVNLEYKVWGVGGLINLINIKRGGGGERGRGEGAEELNIGGLGGIFPPQQRGFVELWTMCDRKLPPAGTS